MGGTIRMSGIAHGIAAEPVFYDKKGIVRSKPQVTNAKKVSTETAAEARAKAKARKVLEK